MSVLGEYKDIQIPIPEYIESLGFKQEYEWMPNIATWTRYFSTRGSKVIGCVRIKYLSNTREVIVFFNVDHTENPSDKCIFFGDEADLPGVIERLEKILKEHQQKWLP